MSHIFSNRRQFLGSLSASAGALALPQAWAQAPYPNKPLTMVHSFAAGSGTDNTGRIISDRLREKLGQPVIVVNKPGAGALIGTEFASKQPADGHTLIMVAAEIMSVNPVLYRNPGYSVSDFDPITIVGFMPLVLMAPPNFKYNTLQELRAAAQTSKDPFSFATWGVGSMAHLYGIAIEQEVGIKMNFAPFTGAAPSTQALLGGHVDLTLATAFTSAEHIKAGRAKALAIGGTARDPHLPNVPTFAELGFPNVGAVQWHGVAMRAGGNREMIDKVYHGVVQALAEPDTKEKVMKAGYSSIDGRTPAAFSAFLQSEAPKWQRVVKASGVSVER